VDHSGCFDGTEQLLQAELDRLDMGMPQTTPKKVNSWRTKMRSEGN
jgi:hypothetical protein